MLCCILLLLCLQVTVGDDEDAPLLKVSDPANNAINLIPTVPVHMLHFQTRHINALLLRMAATMDLSSPVASLSMYWVWFHGSSHTLW